MTSEIVLNSASYMPSSAGVNLCILSPDYNSITQKRNILVFCKYWTYRDKPEEIIYRNIWNLILANRKVTRDLSSTFNNHSTSTQEQISSQVGFQIVTPARLLIGQHSSVSDWSAHVIGREGQEIN